MCWFITVGVRPRGVVALRTAVAEVGVELWPARNPHVARCFPPGDVRFLLLKGGCSCGLVHSPPAPASEAKRARAARRKGWSRAKLQRALESARQDAARKLRVSPSLKLREALAAVAGAAGGVRVFAQGVSGSPDEEPVDPQPVRLQMRAGEFVPAPLPSHTLVDVTG